MPALLKGLVFGPTGCAMTPSHARQKGKLYRYYVSMSVLKVGPEAGPVRRIPAGDLEAAVITELRRLLQAPEMIVATWSAANQLRKAQRGKGSANDCLPDERLTEDDAREALFRFDVGAKSSRFRIPPGRPMRVRRSRILRF